MFMFNLRAASFTMFIFFAILFISLNAQTSPVVQDKPCSASQDPAAPNQDMSKLIKSKLKGSAQCEYIKHEEMVKWIKPDSKPELVRTIIRYLIHDLAAKGAYTVLEKSEDIICKIGLEKDFALLKEVGMLESSLLERLSQKKVTLTLSNWPSKVKLQSVIGNELVCIGKVDKNFDQPLPVGCKLINDGKAVEVRNSFSNLALKTFITLCKTKLKLKSAEDRLGYAKICVLRADETNFKKEIKRVKTLDQDKKILRGLLSHYIKAKDGAALLTFLAGDKRIVSDGKNDKLHALLNNVDMNPLNDAIGSRMKPIIRRVMLENALAEYNFLKTLKGFDRIDKATGKAYFTYNFNSSEELDDFIKLPSAMNERLKTRYKVDPTIPVEPFHIKDGKLACCGLGAIAFKPVFKGDMDLAVYFKVVREEGVGGDQFYYPIFGYGLDSEEKYICSTCLTYVEIQSGGPGNFSLHKACGGQKSAEHTRGCVIHLKGSADRIAHGFNNEDEWSLPLDGERTGYVFLWLYGQRRFEIDKLEISASIETDWLVEAADKAVTQELASLK